MGDIIDISEFKSRKEQKRIIPEQPSVDKEFEEFINLLRYSVTMSPPRYPEIHVYCDEIYSYGHKMTDKNAHNIPTPQEVLDTMEESGHTVASSADVLIARLVVLAPKRVILHESSHLDINSIYIIQQVFTNVVLD